MSAPRTNIAVAPDSLPAMHTGFTAAVKRAGGAVVPLAEASALMWADPAAADQFGAILADAPQVEWIQLPYAGVETFGQYLDEDHLWTCAKGVYATPVAEHVLTLALAGLRQLGLFTRTPSWGPRIGRNLLGANVTILGGGGIAAEVIRLLEPFGCDVTVVRKSSEPMAGANRTISASRLMEVLPRTDVLVVAWALTAETAGAVNAEVMAALPAHGWIINVGRGGHIATDDLVAALESGSIGGAGLDVTDPEPLPDGHRLWDFPNVIITPHVGNTAEMGLPLIVARVEENVRRWVNEEQPIGIVDPSAGY